MQTIAWTNMVLTYAEQTDFVTAVVKTFDGEHPCDMCHAIGQGKSQEKSQPVKVMMKWHAVLPTTVEQICLRHTEVRYSVFQEEAPRRSSPPLTRPPSV